MLRLRAFQLIHTAVLILRRDGISQFCQRLMAWLRGKRRYYCSGVNIKSYRAFQRAFEPTLDMLVEQREQSRRWAFRPLLSIVTAVYNPPITIFKQTTTAILAQSYDNWVWHVVDASTDGIIWEYLVEQAAQDARIRPVRLEKNRGISANTNIALRAAEGDYVVMFDHDDLLPPFALFEVADLIQQHPNADFIYSDADKLDERGRRCEPLFKPDWSPDAMLSYNLLNQLSVFRREWLDRVGYLNPEVDGAQDWDLYLRITEQTPHVYHIPRILYHWRKTPKSTAQVTENKPYVREAQKRAISQHLERLGLSNSVISFDPRHSIYRDHPRVMWQPHSEHRVSIIIPSRDQAEALNDCLSSLFSLTTFPQYEVIVVDTGSTASAAHALYGRYTQEPRFRVIEYRGFFNFGKACNLGARSSNGSLLLFLNNDTEILQNDWLERMAQWFDLNNIGVVGPKLLYPNGRLQHAGVIVGLGGLASHLFLNEPENLGTIFGSDCWYRDLLAVTGACLMIARPVFEMIEGFDEAYTLLYSDVDLCLRAYAAGYRVVYTPDARLIHRESTSHKGGFPYADLERASQKWETWLESGDPFFNPNLSYRAALPCLKQSGEATARSINQELREHLVGRGNVISPNDFR